MNSSRRRLYSLLTPLVATALLTGCVAGERYERTISRDWPATGIGHIELREVDGAIHVEAANTDHISLVARIRARGVPPKRNEENDGYFRTAVEGDTLTIGRESHRRTRILFLNFSDLSIDYELRVPQRIALEMHTVNGKIAMRGIDGEASATTVNGAIDIEASGSNELFAKTVNGRVEARFLHDFRGARLKTVNGAVRAVLPASASFSGDFSQVNGDFEAGFPLSIHSHPGARRVSGEVNGGKHELKIETVNGDITVDNTPAPPAVPAAPAPPAPAAPTTPSVTR